ncbi:DNA polymerase III subunit beta [Hoeflea alexandrii]|uniref:Beta sliding clamp n=1 Tax=Hoeflea alexandrii TaxID=288436 RepID=A0ABT1CPL5_9HYPH|nr:DNA polymerase III subunit beta [Hoeflea alexandrii]MCO6407331.1 DNA polymerase III subunit beta [Hoeflea alexandrii]MCY0154272.1 DNA polymerase III subunit beta [Hoeflea alexandrii]
MTMNLTTTAGALHSALKTVGHAIERRNTLPILSHVLIKNDTMTATDLDIEIKTKIPSSSAKGSICLDHRVLSAISGNLPKDTALTLGTIEGQSGASLAFDGGLYTLNTLPAEDYPDPVKRPIKKTIKAPEGFLDKLRFVSHFMSTEETRYYLNGVCIYDGRLVATDGHRLGYVDCGIESKNRPIIPRGAVAALLELGEPSQISFGENVVIFDLPGTVLRSKLIDGTYPDYQRVIPNIADNAPEMTVDGKVLSAAIRRASSLYPFRRTEAVTFALSDDGRLALVRERIDAGTSREIIPATVSGPPLIAALDGRYLQHMVKAHRGSGTLTLRFIDAGSPISVTSEREGFNSILMPMRTGSEQTAREALTLLAPARRLEAAE